MTTFNVALLQISATGEIAKNLEKGLLACHEAKRQGADLALFPEVWQVGYDAKYMNLEFAIDNDSEFVQKHVALAKELHMAIAITYIKKTSAGPTNNILVIDQKGNFLIDYAKVHICNFGGGLEKGLIRGNEFKVADLKFAGGIVKLGVMICMDREFCESARTLSLKGAEIVIIANACDLATCKVVGDARLAGLRGLSYQDLIGTAMTNYPKPKFDGHSCAFDNRGRPLLMADDREGVLCVEFDLEKLREFRKTEWEVRGGPARRPGAYTLDY